MIDWWIRHHVGVLALLAAMALVSGWLLIEPGLREDYRLEAFMASRDESYQRFRPF